MFNNVQLTSKITSQESLALGPGDSDTVAHTGLDSSATLNATTTPKAQAVAPFTVTLASGAGAIDLTAVPTSTGGTQNGATLGAGSTATAVQAIKIQAPATNTNPISVAPAVSNGYSGTGRGFIFNSGGSITLNPGDEILWTNTSGASAPTVATGCKALSLAGTGSSDKLNFSIILG